MEINDADVAELVDARDLKCLATPERFHLFWKTRSRFRHQPAGTKRDLENIFWGLCWPLQSTGCLRPCARCARCTCTAAASSCPKSTHLSTHGSFAGRAIAGFYRGKETGNRLVRSRE